MDPEQTFIRVQERFSQMVTPRIRTALEYFYLFAAITLFCILVVMHANFVQQLLISPKKTNFCREISDISSEKLLTEGACKALLSLADSRESLYGTSSLEHDEENLRKCDCIKQRKLYHSLVLRLSERRMIQKLRAYTEKNVKSPGKSPNPRKKLKSKG